MLRNTVHAGSSGAPVEHMKRSVMRYAGVGNTHYRISRYDPSSAMKAGRSGNRWAETFRCLISREDETQTTRMNAFTSALTVSFFYHGWWCALPCDSTINANSKQTTYLGFIFHFWPFLMLIWSLKMCTVLLTVLKSEWHVLALEKYFRSSKVKNVQCH